MSTTYRKSQDVPTEVLASRLDELVEAITKGPTSRIPYEMSMRIPCELDRDADCVMAEAARRLRAQPREWDAETIKDAPEDARYMVRAADTQLWSWELYTKRVTTDWLWVGGMAGRVVCDRAFGPIPYPGGAE